MRGISLLPVATKFVYPGFMRRLAGAFCETGKTLVGRLAMMRSGRGERFGAERETVLVEPYGAQGGFQIRYPDVDLDTAAAVRQYQRELRAQYPGWSSSLEFQDGALFLTVYPIQEAPAVLMGRFQRRTWQ